MRWDPTQYTRYADERGRPFLDLVAQVDATEPRRVVDLGCGPGYLTALLAERWPSAVVEGIDSSPEMIERANDLVAGVTFGVGGVTFGVGGVTLGGVTFGVGDARSWQMPDDCDVLVSNAMLQWVPGHTELLRSWASTLPSGGWLAVQVPGNFSAPSHTLMRSLAASARWAPVLGDILRAEDVVGSPSSYAELLLDAGLDVNVWESTYLHLLPGPDPVLEWVRGSGLRPVLAALSPGDGSAFEDEYSAALRSAYPATAHGTVFTFRRIFAVAHKP